MGSQSKKLLRYKMCRNLLLLSFLLGAVQSNPKWFILETKDGKIDAAEDHEGDYQYLPKDGSKCKSTNNLNYSNFGFPHSFGIQRITGDISKCDYIKNYDHAENYGYGIVASSRKRSGIKQVLEMYKRKDENTWTSIEEGCERIITRNNDSTWTIIVPIGSHRYWRYNIEQRVPNIQYPMKYPMNPSKIYCYEGGRG